MSRISIFLALVLVFGLAGEARSQEVGSRARELAASLDKEKYKAKEKRYLSIEIYVSVKNVPVAMADKADYSGVYESDGYRLEIKVASDGRATGSGYDSALGSNREIAFKLRDCRIEGALLTGVKAYENGDARTFEAVFVNRSVSLGRNKNNIEERETDFGLGFLDGGPRVPDVNGPGRVFLAKKIGSLVE